MFKPKTEKIENLAKRFPERIIELEKIFENKTNIYIDFANVMGWQAKLGWRIDLKRLKQLLDSFPTINKVKFYYGTLSGDIQSENLIREVTKYGFITNTKPVKIMNLSINISSITLDSTDILKQFIRTPLLQKLNIETIKLLNSKLKDLNKQGILYLEERKCNFDVEIGRDMLIDYDKNGVNNFVLWSGDSDFADPIKQLLSDGKKVVLFSTARKVAVELNELKQDGLLIFDIQKIKDFICWPREMKQQS